MYQLFALFQSVETDKGILCRIGTHALAHFLLGADHIQHIIPNLEGHTQRTGKASRRGDLLLCTATCNYAKNTSIVNQSACFTALNVDHFLLRQFPGFRLNIQHLPANHTERSGTLGKNADGKTHILGIRQFCGCGNHECIRQDYDVLCRLYLLEKLNYTPTVALASALSLDVGTYRNVPLYGACSAYDPEGDEVTFEVVRYAAHGRVSLSDKHTGAYVYTPDSGYVGTDSFDYVVRDKYGNYSTSATVSIRVEATPDSAVFADIEGHTAASSIIRACSTGLMNGTRVGASHYFKPTAAISRAEFLVTAMHAAGIGEADVASYTKTPFADDESIPAAMRGYVALAAERKYISGKTVDGQLCFCPSEKISRAEAAVILSNIIGYATEDTVTAFADADTLPAWSEQALTSLSALGILVPMDGNAYPAAGMTRADTAEWLTRTVRLVNE